MGATDAPAAGLLGPDEAAAGLALSDGAGWNQTLADWRLFLGDGTVFARRAPEGTVVGTAALLPFAGAAWVSLVLVAPAWRRQGIATALVRRCLDRADASGLTCWLDATPDGAAVYEPLGFRAADRLVRLRRPASGGSAAALSAPDQARALDRLVAFDAQALGFDRARLLTALAARPGSALVERDEAVALVREGRQARHVGPVHAASQDAACALLAALIEAEPGPLLVDLFERHHAVRDVLRQRGFEGERPFLRMVRGEPGPRAAALALAGAGPEYG